MAEEVGKHEKTHLLAVAPELSDFYGKIVLKRKFSHRTEKILMERVNYTRLTIDYLNPFSDKYRKMKKLFRDARIIYIKFEFNEIGKSIYFGGLSVLKKMVGGIHSPLYYNLSQTFLSRLHNCLYTSFIYKFFLLRTKKIHVLNKRDEVFLKEKFGINNVIQIYDGVKISQNKYVKNTFNTNNTKKELKIITVGELSLRKGTDIVCEIIKNAPSNFYLSIIGDGPLKNNIESLRNKNYKYYGYIDDEKKLEEIYMNQDVLLFPSRAETLGLVMPEAMGCGLMIVNSKEVALGMPKYIEMSSNSESPEEYIKLLSQVYYAKINKIINRNKIYQYSYKKFSNDIIFPKFLSEFLSIHPN